MANIILAAYDEFDNIMTFKAQRLENNLIKAEESVKQSLSKNKKRRMKQAIINFVSLDYADEEVMKVVFNIITRGKKK